MLLLYESSYYTSQWYYTSQCWVSMFE